MPMLDRLKIWTWFWNPSPPDAEPARPAEVPSPAVEAPAAPAPAAPLSLPAAAAPDADARREEAIQKIREGFEDLSRLISTIGTNVRDQAEASLGIRDRMDALPGLLEESRRGHRAGEELLGLLNQEASEAGLRQREELQILRVLPVALQAMQENELASYKLFTEIRDDLSKRAEFERQMGESFHRFDATLGSLHDATRAHMDQVQALGRLQKALVAGFQKTQARTVEAFELGQERGLEELRQGQALAAHSLAQTQERARRGLVWAAGAAAAVLITVLAVVFAVWTRAAGDLDRSFRAVEKKVAAAGKADGLLRERDRELKRLRQALEAREAGSAGTALRGGEPPSGIPQR
jgi:hypothetical protein